MALINIAQIYINKRAELVIQIIIVVTDARDLELSYSALAANYTKSKSAGCRSKESELTICS